MLPHSLRLSIFFLRLAIGVNFLYLGWSELFSSSMVNTLRGHSLGGVYSWLAGATPFAGVPSAVFAWIFLIIGICITIGLFTRISSIIGIVLLIAALLPTISFINFNPMPLINDEVVVVFALFVLFFGKAGNYLGLDTFLHWSRKHKE